MSNSILILKGEGCALGTTRHSMGRLCSPWYSKRRDISGDGPDILDLFQEWQRYTKSCFPKPEELWVSVCWWTLISPKAGLVEGYEVIWTMLEMDGCHGFCKEMLQSFMEIYTLWMLCCAIEEWRSRILQKRYFAKWFYAQCLGDISCGKTLMWSFDAILSPSVLPIQWRITNTSPEYRTTCYYSLESVTHCVLYVWCIPYEVVLASYGAWINE